MSPKARKEVALQERSSSVPCSSLLYLLDEHWFFCNALNGDLAATKQSLQRGPLAAVAATTTLKLEKKASLSAGKLIRTTSLPPLQVCYEGSGRQEEETSAKSIAGPRQPRRETSLYRRCANPHFIMCWEASIRKAFQNKKWRSLGDLEKMELQGFKDLGFVFDEREGLSPSLFKVIPALCPRKKEEEDREMGLYLPEVWFRQRSAPPMVLRRISHRSVDGMKEQLRFWARAVACNLRQEC